MTAKRFTIEKKGGMFYLFDNGNLIPIYDGQPICDLLNELHEENLGCENEIARLELIINKLKDKDYENYAKKIQELQRENGRMQEEIECLSEENKELKKELEECNYLCFNCEFSGNFEIECWCDKADCWVDCRYDCEDFRRIKNE